jgi:hypothetical protein
MAKQDLTTPAAGGALVDHEAFAAQLLGGLQESRAVVLNTGGGGKPLLRLLKDGDWVFGQDDADVQAGSHWAINVASIGWGSVCWTNYPAGQKNKRLGLVVVPITQAKPATPAPIEGFPFTDFVTFDMLCLDGDDEGTEVTYGTSSIGGMRAFTKLRDAIIAQLQKDVRTPCPVVTLTEESYKGAYGKTYNPIFNITGWADLGGVVSTETKQAEEALPGPGNASPAAAAEPARKRKPALGATGADLAQAAAAAAVDAAKSVVEGAAAAEKAAKQAKARAAYEAARKALEDEEGDAGGVAAQPGSVEPEPLQSTQQAHTGQRRRHRPAA